MGRRKKEPEKVIVNCTPSIMKKCKYKSRLGDNGQEWFCDYIGHTFHMRGCPPTACDKFTTGRTRQKKNQPIV